MVGGEGSSSSEYFNSKCNRCGGEGHLSRDCSLPYHADLCENGCDLYHSTQDCMNNGQQSEDEATASVRMKGVEITGPSNPLGVGITKATGKKAEVDHNKTIIKGPVREVTKLSLIRKLMIPL